MEKRVRCAHRNNHLMFTKKNMRHCLIGTAEISCTEFTRKTITASLLLLHSNIFPKDQNLLSNSKKKRETLEMNAYTPGINKKDKSAKKR